MRAISFNCNLQTLGLIVKNSSSIRRGKQTPRLLSQIRCWTRHNNFLTSCQFILRIIVHRCYVISTSYLSETPPQAHEAFSMPAGILQRSTSHILFYSTVSIVFSYHALAGPQQPKIRYTHCRITTTANSLDFFKEFLWMAFAVLFLSCQCYLLQTISWEVLVFQVYLEHFSWYSKKLGHKLCSSYKPVLPEKLNPQEAD